MDKSGAKFKFVGHSTEIIRQSKNKGTLSMSVVFKGVATFLHLNLAFLFHKQGFVDSQMVSTVCNVSK